MSNEVLLVLGSNLDSKKDNINRAIQRISIEFDCIKKSSFYESKAWGYESDNDFLNVALIIHCEINPKELLKKLLKIENELGRNRSVNFRYNDRTIDIDIILFGDQIVNEAELVIPHPRFHIRNFCLKPMLEIAPLKLVPGLNKTVIELYDDYSKSQISDLNCVKI